MSDNKVVITREFNAPVEKVWAAWTEPEQIQKWWGPQYFTAPVARMDVRVGGKYLLCMRGAMGPGLPEQDMYSTGTYEEIVPLKKLAYSDSFSDADGNPISPKTYGMEGMPDVLHVTVELEALEGGKTKMTLTHVGAPDGSEHARNMTIGWNQSFDKLVKAVEE